ncbi:Furin [Plecturocebus cupreus]
MCHKPVTGPHRLPQAAQPRLFGPCGADLLPAKAEQPRESPPEQQPPWLLPEVEKEPQRWAGLLPSHLPKVVASLSCAFIVLVFVTVFLVLQLRSGFRF